MKKLIFALFVLNVSASAFAQQTEVPADTIALNQITEGRVVDGPAFNPNLCPRPAVCDPAAVVVVEFTLSGCMNTLGPVTADIKHNRDGKIDVNISALEIVSSQSAVVRCKRAPVGVATFVVGMGFVSKDQVQLHFLKHNASVKTR